MVAVRDVLTELCSLPGPAGFEEPVTSRVKDLLEPLVDETWTDVMGNVIGVRRCGKENPGKLLLDAHVDEVGLVVTGVEEGFLRFTALGGLDARVLPASDVMIQTDPPLYGVICVLPPHVIKKEDEDKPIKIEDMYIDVGMSDEDTKKAVSPGTPGVLAHGVRNIGESGLCGKALDDRAGLAAILRALDMLRDEKIDTDLYVMASVQEEVGCRGAAPGAFAIGPDRCIVIDVGFAKTPDTKPTEVSEELGGGVIISRGPNMNRGFTEHIIGLAKEHDIKHQINVEPGGNSGTNTHVIQISRDGVATVLLSVPLRYMHGAYEYVILEDIESTAKLICEAARLPRPVKG